MIADHERPLFAQIYTVPISRCDPVQTRHRLRRKDQAVVDLMGDVPAAGELVHDDSVKARQRQVVALLAQGLDDRQVARTMHLSIRSVRRDIAGAMTALSATTRFAAGVAAVRHGWVEAPADDDGGGSGSGQFFRTAG